MSFETWANIYWMQCNDIKNKIYLNFKMISGVIEYFFIILFFFPRNNFTYNDNARWQLLQKVIKIQNNWL